MKENKFLCVLLISMLIFQIFLFSYMNITVEASEFVMPSDAYMKSILAPLLVASGLVFSSQEALDDTVEKVKLRIIEGGLDSTVPRPPGDPRPPRSIRDIITSLASVHLVYDFVSGGYKQVVDAGSDFFNFIKNWVDETFNEGENIVLPPGYYMTSSLYPGFTFPSGVTEMYFYNGNFTQSSIRLYGLNLSAGTIKVDFPVSTVTSEYPIPFYYDSSKGLYLSDVDDPGPNGWLIGKNPPYYSFSYESPVVDTSINGAPGIVDNPDYDWSNASTGEKIIVFPVETDAVGAPVFTPDGVPSPAIDPDYMVNANPEEIPLQDPTGVTVTDPEVIPSIPTVPGTEGTEDIEIDNPAKRTLLQTKFPFCLPWDLKTLFSLFNAPMEAPRFEIDFIPVSFKNKVGVTGSTEFVLDMADFPLVGQMSRFFNFVGSCLGLILVTRKLINS